MFDTETTIDTRQELTFGAYRRCELVGDAYVCAEEGLFYADDASAEDRRLLDAYVRREDADVRTKSFPSRLRLKLYSRSTFIEKRFWKSVQAGEMIVGFNLPFDLSRLAVDWRTARNRGWSLILSLRRSRKTGRLEPNPHRPRIRVTARNSRAAFMSLTRPQRPDEWPAGRFLDLHTLASALLDGSYSLERLCEQLRVRGKVDHEPTGRISPAEITYCREDVRATTDVLNALKWELDQHPIALRPDLAYSPASIVKDYLDAMGVIPPREKFQVSDDVLGIAMQAYYVGRAECRIRRTEVPVIHTDFTSQYPTVNVLLGNWQVLTAKDISFEDASDDVRALLAQVTPDQAFAPEFWKQLSFFALVRPDDDILPVRTTYNGQTQNIGVNRLRSAQPVWFAGPDVVASALLAGKAPHVVKAIRLVPHGRQPGLRCESAWNIDPFGGVIGVGN